MSTMSSIMTQTVRSVDRKLDMDSKGQDIALIWVDALIDSSPDCIEVKSRLRLIVDYLITFTQVDECLEYIRSNNDINDPTFICLITSGVYSSQTLSAVRTISKVQFIAIYCFDTSLYECKNEEKLLGIFINFDTLLDALNKPVNQLRDTLVSISTFPVDENKQQYSLKDLSKENANFIWFQLLIETLFRLPQSDEARETMLNECERQYNDNTQQLATIREFKDNYRPEDAAKWYTRDAFLYRIINRALRTQSIDTILIFYPFIRDLHHQLVQLHVEIFECGAPPLLTVYRGQSIHVKELDKIRTNVGGLLSMNAFFSTSLDRDLALRLAGSGSSTPSDIGLVSTFFEVVIDTCVSSVPYGNLLGRTYFPGENEFLFSVGALFRVESCVEIIENDQKCSYWLVVLRLVDKKTEQKLYDLFDYFTTVLIGQRDTDIETLVVILFRMGNLEGAQRFSERLRNEFNLEPKQQAVVYNNLGFFASKKDGYTKALDWYQQALNIYTAIDPITQEISVLKAATLGNIAYIDYQLGNYDRALEKYHQVLNMQPNSFDQRDNELVIHTLSNVGVMYKALGQFKDALSYCGQALHACSRFLPIDHPTAASVLDNMGSIYDALGNGKHALDCYERSLKILISSLPPGHYSLASSHLNLGITYLSYGNYHLAQKHLESAWTIDQQHKFHLDPVDMAKTLNGFGQLYSAQNNYAQALHYYELALNLIPPQHPDVILAYRNIGTTLGALGRIEDALAAFEKARTHPASVNNEVHIADVLHSRGLVQFKSGNSFSALMSFQHALVIRQRWLPALHPKTAKLYNEMGGVCLTRGFFSKALEHFRHTLFIEQKTLSEGHIEISRTLNNIAVALYRLGQYKEAASYGKRAFSAAVKVLGPVDPLVIGFARTLTFILQKLPGVE